MSHSATNGHGSDNPDRTRGHFPANSRDAERQQAQARRQSFPYRFPVDRRQLKPGMSVEENARRLMRCFYLERRLAQAIGAWTLAIPDFEVKLECGRHLFYHADAARALRERLHEQELGLKAIDAFRDEGVDQFIEELLSAADAPELLVGLHQVAGQALATAYRHHQDDTDPITDAPTIRLMQRVLLDYEPMLEWANRAIEAYVVGGVDEARLSAWRWHLQRLLGSIGGAMGVDSAQEAPAPLRCQERPFVRCTVPQRDSRFLTFKHTGEYDVGDGEPRFPDDSYDYARLRFLRTQRDEVDAIEAFGTFLWDIRFKDFDAEYHLARVTWDETRHTEIGHRALLAAGYDPYELPNRLTGSTCRGPMEPAYAMAEINLFGEVGVIKTIGGFIGEAREKSDVLLAHVADYIRADERTHVRKGQYIIRQMTDQGMQELEQRTRELFTECLVNLGAVKLDMDVFTVSREDIERLVGE